MDYEQIMGAVAVIPTGKGDQVALYVLFDDGRGDLLDYYDTAAEGESIARHFSRCCDAAYDEGYCKVPGYFLHLEDGCGVSFVEALIKDRISPAQFRVILRQTRQKSVRMRAASRPK